MNVSRLLRYVLPQLLMLVSASLPVCLRAQCPSIDYEHRSTFAPYVAAGWDTVAGCNGGIWLKASTVVTSATFNGTYRVESIPFNPPHPFNTGTQIFVNEDDIFADSITLPFGFCFFGQTYNTACVGANGVISMGSSMARRFCEYDYNQYSPIPNAGFPIKNAIYGIYEDIDPSRGSSGVANQGIYQAIVGQYPCRQLCVSWNGIVQYGRASILPWQHSSRYSIYQIVMHEGTNIIDVYVQRRKCCSSTNNGYGTIGIQNAAGTSAFTAPGRNGWTGDIETPEAWRFIPQGPLNYTVTWYLGADTSAATGLVVGRGDSVFVNPATPTTYTARLTYMACSGLNYDLAAQVTVGIDTCRAQITSTADMICPSQQATISLAVPPCANVESIHWSTGDTSRSITVSPTATTSYSATVTYHNGCTQTLSKSLAVRDTVVLTRNDTTVENSLPFVYRSLPFYAPTAGRFIYNDTSGCPIVENWSLHVWMNRFATADSTICENSLPLLWNGRTFTGPDTAAALFSSGGCHGEDSTVTMRLRVNRNTRSTIYDTTVQNRLPLTLFGATLSTSASDTVVQLTIANSRGCDSIIDYRLHVWRNVCDTADSAVCRRSLPLSWNGRTFVDGGLQSATLLTSHGADSLIVMRVVVREHPRLTVRDTIVERQLPWYYRGRVYTAEVHTDSFIVASGASGACDSIISYSLHVWRNTSGSVDTAVCASMLPLWWHGHRFDTAALHFRDTLRGAGLHGVDSILDMRLTVNPVYAIELSDTICVGQSLFFCGAPRDSAALYTCSLLTAAGCDSAVSLSLAVNSHTNSYISDTIVQRQLPFTRFGLSLRSFDTRAGMTEWDTATVITTTNAAGCDSIIHYALHVHLNSYDTIDSAACINSWHGEAPPTTSPHVVFIPAGDTLLSANGADSIVTCRLTLLDTSSTDLYEEACERYVWYAAGAQSYRASGVYTTTLAGGNGCDSVLHLHLTIHRNVRVTDPHAACDSFLWCGADTVSLTSGGTYTTTLRTAHGCDSVVILYLTIYRTRRTELADTFCRNEQYRFGTRVISEPGTYYDTLRTVTGNPLRPWCDSLVTLRLASVPQPPLSIDSTYSCSDASYLLTANSTVSLFSWSSSPDDPTLGGREGRRTIAVNPTRTTVYTVSADYPGHYSCPSFRSITLEPLVPLKAVMELSPAFLTYDRNTLTAIDRSHGNEGRRWFVDSAPFGAGAVIHYTNIDRDSLTIQLEVFNNICHDTATRVVYVRKYALWVPNAFTPDAPDNRTFAAIGEGIADFEMSVYSRNGVMVFYSNDIHQPWDGTYRGHPCPYGAYTYIIRYRHIGTNEAYENQTGAVLLIR